MKVITYSQVPQKSTYVHLAYLSASDMMVPGPGALMGFVLLVIYLAGLALKVNVKYPRPWRLFLVCSIATILIVLFILSHSNSASL
jgi:hypothetical protein